MNKHTEAELEDNPLEYIADIGGKTRLPLLMVPKDNLFDPYFPTVLYRKGKFVTTEQAQRQATLEYMSKALYDECVREGEDVVGCYRKKCTIFRRIVGVLYRKE